MHVTIKQSAWENGAPLFHPFSSLSQGRRTREKNRQRERWLTSTSHQRLNVKRPYRHSFEFNHWLAGLTDGDGHFSANITAQGSCEFTFKIALSTNNLQLLYYIKSKLKVGSVSYAGENTSQFRIRDTSDLKKYILPIFDQSPLFSIKAYDYEVFKQALGFMDDPTLSVLERNRRILFLQEASTLQKQHPSPAWNKKVPCRSWIVGFTEAEGSFYIVKKEENRYSHGFGFTQKSDSHVLKHLRSVFGIRAKVKWNKNGFWGLDTTNSRSIETLKEYYKGCFKGNRSLDYRIWTRSLKHKGNPQKLLEIQTLMRRIRKLHEGSPISEQQEIQKNATLTSTGTPTENLPIPTKGRGSRGPNRVSQHSNTEILSKFDPRNLRLKRNRPEEESKSGK